MYKKILLPTDGSKNAEMAVDHVFRFGSRSGAEIIILYVIETPRFTGIRSADKSELKKSLESEGQKSFDRITDRLNSLSSGEECEKQIKLNFQFKEGSAADIILNTIDEENIELVVMGTSGKRGFNRFLLGSVAENVVRSAPCPVLVVR